MKEFLIRLAIGFLFIGAIILFVNTMTYFMPYSGYVLFGLLVVVFANVS